MLKSSDVVYRNFTLHTVEDGKGGYYCVVLTKNNTVVYKTGDYVNETYALSYGQMWVDIIHKNF